MPLAEGQNIGVTNQIDVAHPLDTHHADQRALLLIAPEHDLGCNLAIELLRCHIGLVPPVGGNHSAISLCRCVYDFEDVGTLILTARADDAHDTKVCPGPLPGTTALPTTRLVATGYRTSTWLDCMARTVVT